MNTRLHVFSVLLVWFLRFGLRRTLSFCALSTFSRLALWCASTLFDMNWTRVLQTRTLVRRQQFFSRIFFHYSFRRTHKRSCCLSLERDRTVFALYGTGTRLAILGAFLNNVFVFALTTGVVEQQTNSRRTHSLFSVTKLSNRTRPTNNKQTDGILDEQKPGPTVFKTDKRTRQTKTILDKDKDQ